MKFDYKSLLIIFLGVILFYLPILINQDLVLKRNNDLQQQFWPIFYFIKEQFWQYHEFPLWNNMFFSGLPLLPDPQFSLFYPVNIVFLILPTNLAFIIYFLIHSLTGGIGLFLLLNKHFKLSQISSLFASYAFLFSPRLAGYLEAGHSGLVASWGMIPWVILAIFALTKKPQSKWALLLGLSLAGILFTHTITFLITIVAGIILLGVILVFFETKNRIKSFIYFLLSLIYTFGLTAISLLPQLNWSSETTRQLLLQTRDVYPKWVSVKEFLIDIFFPFLNGNNSIWQIDTEKWLSLGFLPSLLAVYGFWQLRSKLKLILLFSFLTIALISLNNASPIYRFLITLDLYALTRVATRVWFIPAFIVIILASFGLEKIIKNKRNHLISTLIIFLTLIELLFISWSRLNKPVLLTSNYAPSEVYQFLSQDHDRFRIFCPEHCLAQQEATKARLELVEGYNTLQQTNYYKHMWQLSGGYWNHYTLTLPPLGNFRENKLQSDAASLGDYNVKYVLSTYPLTDNNFQLEKNFGKFTLYRNKLLQPRAYFKNVPTTENEAPILSYSPNYISVDTSQRKSNQLILSEVYNQGWKAYLNGKEKAEILETPVSLRLVNINPTTEFVDFKYEPDSYQTGKLITGVTILLLIIFGGFNLKKTL